MKDFLASSLFVVVGAVLGAAGGAIFAKVVGWDVLRISLACAAGGVIGTLTDRWMQSTS